MALNKTYDKKLAKRAKPWFQVKGDKTLRLNYNSDLHENSVIFDLGGFEGQWASDIYSKYNSEIYIFEPVNEYCKNISDRFQKNKKIKVFNYGLGPADGEFMISVDAASSSIYKGNGTEKIQIKPFLNFVNNNKIEKIDLLKINIEGAEYDLLENLIESEYLNKIINIQIQFHDFFKDSEKRMNNIKHRLEETHYLTYCYEFIWENWRLKK